ncbi:MAG TPA: DUF1990 domain-containing protein [Pyrinomonadaceae bacterium]|nr:DUF1990 domain-containing protein [Pyrinomonadaceae bacterium]
MFFLTEPSADTVTSFINAQHGLPFSYQAVGATNGSAPEGYVVDHNRTQIGTGAAIYKLAKDALNEWKQFDLGWVSIVPAGVQLKTGATVAVKAYTFGAWSLNAARVVYVINEAGPTETFGFAYGTLPDHVETGEERFKVEWNLEDDSVWYDILAFSRPHHTLVKLAAPLARQLQKRFARESMRRIVELTSGAR